MTFREARKKAKRLWGQKASVARRSDEDMWAVWRYGRFNVNSGTWACNDGKGKVNIWGNGHTWEAAFQNAKQRYKYWEL